MSLKESQCHICNFQSKAKMYGKHQHTNTIKFYIINKLRKYYMPIHT